MRRLVLGTRGSDLARAQAALVQCALAIDSEIEIIRTSGDERSGRSPEPLDRHAGRKGMFTAEIQRALLGGRIDVAVHSAKDLPSEATDGLEICAALPRAAIEDVLISKQPGELREGATVATGSVRRQHQLRFTRPDVKVVDLRGNVPTRLRKLIASDWDAIILARAGLERLGFDCAAGVIEFEGQQLPVEILPIDNFLPAGGQGIVALEIRRDDEQTREVVEAISDRAALFCLRAEREFLRLLNGDCGTPVGVIAALNHGTIEMQAQIFDEGRVQPRAAALRKDAAAIRPEAIAAELFDLIHGSKN
ncbi:MAG: hydroxymethylbilane synthase [Verrucomicrobiota bacterium]|nr:hydroxymethylbilane synthase [Verrucomicrobiota bacterium]